MYIFSHTQARLRRERERIARCWRVITDLCSVLNNNFLSRPRHHYLCGDWWGSTTLTRSPVLIKWTLKNLLMIFKVWSPSLAAQSPPECPWSNHFWFVLCRKKQTIMLKIIKSWPKQTCWFRNFPSLELLGRSALRYERWSWYRRTQNTVLFLFRCVSMT